MDAPAAAVAEDSQQQALVRPLLSSTVLETAVLRCQQSMVAKLDKPAAHRALATGWHLDAREPWLASPGISCQGWTGRAQPWSWRPQRVACALEATTLSAGKALVSMI